MPWGKGSHRDGRDKFPTMEEVRAVLKASRRKVDLHLAVRLAWYFGLRCGEIRILRGRQCDVHRKTLWAPTLKRIHKKNQDPARRKAADVPEFALSCPKGEALEVLAECARRGRVTEGNPEGWVFPSEKVQGRPRPTSWFRKWFIKARGWAKVRETFSFHGLRHAHGSQVARGTKDPVFVRDRLRHSDIKTSNIYMHAADRYEQELGQVLNLDEAPKKGRP